MMGGWALGIVVDDHAQEDTRVEQLERRVRELEAELERRGDDPGDE